ncbi:hypothetical protein WJX81_006226 [Elliptochloris bilobata]|uniref:CUE domain-containing protein n=1 Tax=Elliptochloris bilobata TaxID=381761 RepID=A0AAW1SLD8_9CHLO
MQYARRSHDATPNAAGEASAARRQLAKRVFSVLLRMVTTGERGGPAAAEQADALYSGWLLDVPKLMDVAVLWGGANGDLVRRFMQQVFELQPRYAGDVAGAAAALVGNLADVHEALSGAAQRALLASDDALATGLADGVAYLRDATATLAAFADSFPPAAGLMLAGGDAALLGALAGLHDALVPQLAAVKRKGSLPPLGKQLVALRALLQRAAAALLAHAFLRESAPGGPNPNPAARAAASAWVALDAHSPAQRGEALLAAVVAASGGGKAAGAGLGSGPAGVGGSGEEGALLRALGERWRVTEALSAALTSGYVALEPVQEDYMYMLLGGRPRSAPAGASGSGAAAQTRTPAAAAQAQAAAQAAAIAQVQDVLPGYGAGFIAACLGACGGDPERAVHQLLEGTLPQELASLDPHMPAAPPANPADCGGKGKARGGAASVGRGGELSWRDVDGATAGAPFSAPASAEPRLTSAAQPPRPVPRGVSRMLRTAGADRAAIQRFAEQAQWSDGEDEYNDEYDDSFDDLQGGAADGVADAEGDDDAATPASQRTAGPSNSSRGPSPSSSRGPSPMWAGGGARGGASREGGRGHGRDTRLWVADGKVYNYRREGATEVAAASAADASARARAAAAAAAQAIHGLGPGGNVPLAAPPGGSRGAPGRGGGGGGDEGPGGSGGGGRNRGGDRAGGDYAYKDKHKSAVANHHRKDRALRKAGGALG